MTCCHKLRPWRDHPPQTPMQTDKPAGGAPAHPARVQSGPLFRSAVPGRSARAIVATAVLASAATARAQQGAALGPRNSPNGLTWGEFALLPEYCRDAQGILYGDQSYNPSPRAAHWVALMGQGFWAIHHYCYALAHVRQAEEAGLTPQERKFIYGRAIQDYVCTLNNSAPDMVLLPEILVRMGEAYLKVGSTADAYPFFEMARRIKPDHWSAYSRWIDVLVRSSLRGDGATSPQIADFPVDVSLHSVREGAW